MNKLNTFSRAVLSLALLFAGFTQSFSQSSELSRWSAIKARSIGPAGMSGRVTAIDAVVANPYIMYVGSASGGLWKSESGGDTWTPLFDGQAVASIGAISIYQKNPSIIWVGTGEGNPRNSQNSGNGVYRSLDGGRSWQHMGLEKTRNIHRIIVHPDNPDIVFVGAQGPAWGDESERGVFKSSDGGKSWQKVLYTNERSGVGELVMDPANPDKLFAAMWEFRRQPWNFQSGGPGSGLYVSHDGGNSWQRRTAKDGLPEGELGRMGLAVARSNPKVVYALIEAKKNALYRSEDGGFSFSMVNDRPEIGDRPFYYAEIYVDSKNENRLYTLYSRVAMSEDGGRNFRVILPYEGVHPDHHAWWIHPENPNFIIEGNDGGLAISQDRGKSWRFVDNLPLGQFYHVNVDNDKPYNIYGGLQDNGSWRGPAYLWKNGGIRNSYWQMMYFGDGFDVLPDPADNRYGYAMSQGGNLGRYDLRSGQAKFIKPTQPEGQNLRFNWNAALAQDPFDPAAIYYGSQFVHKSSDRGDNWTIISPDLTSNDPEKQKQENSGGLTLDVTNAENHCTLLSIAPSPRVKGLLWTGSDDGRLHLSRDGGATWTRLDERIKGMPANAWIPQIHASAHQDGEAYVVVNNYRQHDWKPYLFRTRDFGRTWERIADENSVLGYVLCVVQDPVEPKLLFMGTEHGLYASTDGGANWRRWPKDYPTAPTMDMVIHPREHDLVVATFGRAIWVLDDISPLRALARDAAALDQKEVTLFAPPAATLARYTDAPGVLFPADAVYAGENRPQGAMISFYVKNGAPKSRATGAPGGGGRQGRGRQESPSDAPGEKAAKADTLLLQFFDAERVLLRSLRILPDTGLNRVYWDMRRAGARWPMAPKPKAGDPEPSGAEVFPGEYWVRVSWKGQRDSAKIRVDYHPDMQVNPAALQARLQAIQRMERMSEGMAVGLDRLGEMGETIGQINALLQGADSSRQQLRTRGKALQDSLNLFREVVAGKREVKGIYRSPNTLMASMGQLRQYAGSSFDAPSDALLLLTTQEETRLAAWTARINRFLENDWMPWRQQVEQARISLFKDYKALE